MTEQTLLKAIKIAEILEGKEMSCSPEQPAKTDTGYYIVRTYSAGVFAGNIESRNGQEVVMINVRRLWQWSGAASLSQLAMEGTKKPNECKFPCEVTRIIVTQAIEILDVTPPAEKSIKEVPIWQI